MSYYPSLLQINTRVWLTELARRQGRAATLDDIPDTELDRLAQMGIDWAWFLSVWQTGPAGQRVSRTNPEWRREFEESLPDLREEDIVGSGFAISAYKVHEDLGGDAALARLRKRLSARGLRLMLDFIPNHTALDHPWVTDQPDFYLRATEAAFAQAPGNYTRVRRADGDMILAHGRDPNFPAWPDALQLNYGNPAAQEAMVAELLKIAGQCDGVRCDMAMLVLPQVFERTWGVRARPFWPRATQRVRERFPDFCFMAEVYWDLEWTMQQQGFDYAYDKRLYDRLRAGNACSIREHLHSGLDYQSGLARFLENHDESRAAVAFDTGAHPAAAAITYLAPGLRFFHQGQFDGRRGRISPHLVRGPDEPANPPVHRFYERLLEVLRLPTLRQGRWQLLECVPAWEGNSSCDAFVAYAWEAPGGERLLVCVNYAAHPSQCYVRLPFPELRGQWRLKDLMNEAHYLRDGNDLQSHGLYLDMAPWQYHVFEMRVADAVKQRFAGVG